MAINPESQYPGKIDPSTADYPYGAARNVTIPGDGTGTPWEAALVNDLFGFLQALLSEVGAVPTGTPDKVGASQYLEAVKRLNLRVVADISTLDADATLKENQYVYVTGRTTAGEIPGVYKIVSAGTADGGRLIDLSTSGLKAQLVLPRAEILPAEQYGAAGDGSTDDTAEITAAGAAGLVECNQTYKTTFTAMPAYVRGKGKLILASPVRQENVDKTGGGGLPRAKPTGFSFVPSRKIICQAVGAASHGIDLLRQFEQDFTTYFGASEYWVDPVNGNDANIGSIFAPVQTVKAAYQKIAPGTIRLKEGTYTDRFFLEFSDNTTGGGTVARPIRIVGMGNVIIRAPGDQPSALTWTLDATYSPATYSATPSGSETINAIVWTHGGEEILLPYYSVGGDLASVSLGWFQDAGTKEVHIKLGGFNVETDKANVEIMYSRGATIGLSGATTYLENVTIRGDSQFDLVHDGSGNRSTLYHKNCVFEYLENANIHTEGAKIYSQNAIIRRALNGDGLNYYDEDFPIAGGDVTEAIEIDCQVYDNGIPVTNLDAGDPSVPSRTWDGTRNKQGSSGHFNSVICRINGVYRNNFAQNIADTGAGSRTWMIGSDCRDLYTELYAGGDYGGRYMGVWTEGTAHLDTVASKGETLNYGFYNQTGTSKHFNPDYQGATADYALAGGGIEAYRPDSP